MEHHLLPIEPTSSEIRVPCICEPPYYDGEPGSFIIYPRTKGKPWLVHDQHSSVRFTGQIGTYIYLHQPPMRDLQIFCQQWLFFGFLKEVLEEDFKPEDFVSEMADGTYITTQHLELNLEKAWSRRLDSRLHASATHKHFSDCMRIFDSVVRAMLMEGGMTGLYGFVFDWRIVLSIFSSAHMIGRSLLHATSQKYGDLGYNVTPVESGFFPNDAIQSEMKVAGWCPSELHAIKTKFANLQTLVALSRMDRTFLSRNHEGCTEKYCTWHQIDISTYQPKHRPGCDQCRNFENVEMDTAVRRILDKVDGGLPVLKISGEGESPSIQVIETTPDMQYIAISHVWADGLGNPSANSLPTCQIIRLRQLADDLGKKINPTSDTEEMHIWIDTLCCPWEPSPAKKKAIMRLRETYANAKHVLVLDTGLQSVNSSIRPTWETLLWIFCSGWTTRLWTLQEGMLPKNLWFQFQDQPQNSDTLKDRLFQEVRQNARVEGMGKDLHNQHLWLDRFRSSRKDIFSSLTQDSPGLADFIILNQALQHRTVTFPADEAICVSLLTEFPLDQLLANENADVEDQDGLREDRMCKIWTWIDKRYGIPFGILTLGYLKLRRPGFRWAPRSLIENTAGINWLYHMTFPKIGRIVQSDNSGLLFKSVGFIVYHREWQDGLKRNPLDAMSPFLNFTRATFKDRTTGTFYRIFSSGNVEVPITLQQGPGYEFPEETPLAIIPATEFDEAQACEALLGKVERLRNARHKVTEFVRVGLAKYSHSESLILNTAEEIALSARSSPYIQRMNDFKAEDKDSEEFQTCSRNVKSFFAEAATGRRTDEKVLEALQSAPTGRNEHFLEIITFDWLWSDYIAEKFGEEKEWCVD